MKKSPEPQKTSKKQQQLIMAAGELFHRHGVRRVTIEEICREAGVSKMTFYKYFTDKWNIAKVILDILFDEGIKHFYEMLDEAMPFSQKLEMIFTLTTNRVHAVGEAFLNDVMREDSPLHDYFLKRQKMTRELSIEFFNKARKDGLMRSDITMPLLLFMLDQLCDLLNHPDFIKIMPNIEDRACELAAFFFHGFSREAV